MANPILTLASRAAQYLPGPIKRALYRLGPITRIIRGTLNRAAPQGLSEVEIAAGSIKGLRFNLDMQSEKDYWLGTYETDLQNALTEFVKPGMVAYDVGANVGYVSLLLGKAVGPSGQVFCFEALPGNVERLQSNLVLNPEVSQFTITGKAVTNKSGTVDFLVHHSDDMGKAVGSAGRDEAYTQTITLPSINLDDFIFNEGNPKPSVVKIDIEGGEVLALPGMKRMLIEIRPIIMLEMHGPDSGQAAWDTLKGANYTIHKIQSGYPHVESLEDLNWKAYLIGIPTDG